VINICFRVRIEKIFLEVIATFSTFSYGRSPLGDIKKILSKNIATIKSQVCGLLGFQNIDLRVGGKGKSGACK